MIDSRPARSIDDPVAAIVAVVLAQCTRLRSLSLPTSLVETSWFWMPARDLRSAESLRLYCPLRSLRRLTFTLDPRGEERSECSTNMLPGWLSLPELSSLGVPSMYLLGSTNKMGDSEGLAPVKVSSLTSLSLFNTFLGSKSTAQHLLHRTALRKFILIHNQGYLGNRLRLDELRVGHEQVRSTLEDLTMCI